MSRNIWFISDTHFGHENILGFTNYDGTPVRPEFSSVEEMDETLIDNWNSVVKDQDKIYHLGDIAMSKHHLGYYFDRLNGKKRLVRGNHDVAKTREYMKYFQDVYGCRTWGRGFIATHIPIHPESVGRWSINLHGHLHCNVVRLPNGEEDPRYLNVSVERVNYTPIHIDEIHKIIKDRGLDVE